MSTKRIGPIAQAWFKWKSLRLPWRKRFLVGYDLQGNTYWEFRLTRESTERWRRIVKYPRSTHFSSVKVSPQWHQWLRYTRDDPPTLNEQQGDVVRQAQLKQLAAAADARWEAKPRLTDAPGEATGQRVPALGSRATMTEIGDAQANASSQEPAKEAEKEEEPVKSDDPWAKAKARGPSEEWQPAAWTPTPTKKR